MRTAKPVICSALLFCIAAGCHSQVSAPIADATWFPSGNFEQADKVVVFVHGLWGTALATWTNTSGQTWQEIIQDDKDLEGWGTAVFEYPQAKSHGFGTEEGSRSLFGALDRHTRNKSAVVIVAHSLGGNVVRLALLNNPGLLGRVRLVLFFATPADGASAAAFAAKLPILDQNRALSELIRGSPILEDIKSRWTSGNYNTRILTACAYETLPFYGNTLANVLIVEKESATALCPTASDPIDRADHWDIVKPLSASSKSHVLLRGWLIDFGRRGWKLREGAAEEFFVGHSSQNSVHRTQVTILPARWASQDSSDYPVRRVVPARTDYYQLYGDPKNGTCLWSEPARALTQAVSVSALVWRNQESSHQHIVAHIGAKSVGSYSLQVVRDEASFLVWREGEDDPISSSHVDVNAGSKDNKWTRLTGTYDARTGNLCLFKNSELTMKGCVSYGGGPIKASPDAPFTIGCAPLSQGVVNGKMMFGPESVTQHFSGAVGPVRVYDRVLHFWEISDMDREEGSVFPTR